MPEFLHRIVGRLRRSVRRRMLRHRYNRATRTPPDLPEPLIWQLPSGFTVVDIGATGVRVVDSFCSRAEAAALIELARRAVSPSTVIGPDGKSMQHDYRTSSDTLFKLDTADPLVRQLVFRSASVLGLPMAHAEAFSLTRYQRGEQYKPHLDHDGSLRADRLYTVLLYLNDLAPEQGGATAFPKLNFVSQPVCGRAIFWVNADLQRVPLETTLHAALPVIGASTEKWVAQMWFRAYPISTGVQPEQRGEPPAAIPLHADAAVPAGVMLPAE